MRLHLPILLCFSMTLSGRVSASDMPDCDEAVRALARPHLFFVENLWRFKGLDFYRTLVALYPEMALLRYSASASPEGSSKAGPHAQSPSLLLFQNHSSEFDRSAVGIRAFQQVITDDYEGLTEHQVPSKRLSRESFLDWRSLTLRVLNRSEDKDAMVAKLGIHDLGKVSAFRRIVEAITVDMGADHDQILANGLKALGDEPVLLTSFARLSDRHRNFILKGMEANLGQFTQGESPEANLRVFQGLNLEIFDFYFLHVLFDVAGTGGAENPLGSSKMTESVYRAYRSARQALVKLYQGSSTTDVYNEFLSIRASELKLPMNSPTDRAVIRLCLIGRSETPEEAIAIQKAFLQLPDNAREILTKELNVSGLNDDVAILPYYAPAMFSILQKNFAHFGKSKEDATTASLFLLTRVLQETREELKGRKGPGVFTANLHPLLEELRGDPRKALDLDEYSLRMDISGEQAQVSLRPQIIISEEGFPVLESLSSLPGHDVSVMGVGSGSDINQMAQFAALLRLEGKNILSAISIRSAFDDDDGIIKPRIYRNHGGEVFPGVFRILPETTGSGRFLENLVAREFPTYVILDRNDGQLSRQTKAVFQASGRPQALFPGDTGGDGLHSVRMPANSKFTPDQDLRSLLSLLDFPDIRIITEEFAVGVDSDENAKQTLQNGLARFFRLSEAQRQNVLDRYDHWGMNGTTEFFGKTQLAWRAALMGRRGLQVLPLPKNYVLNSRNAWNPFVYIQPTMHGIFFMELRDHLRAIGVKLE